MTGLVIPASAARPRERMVTVERRDPLKLCLSKDRFRTEIFADREHCLNDWHYLFVCEAIHAFLFNKGCDCNSPGVRRNTRQHCCSAELR